MSLDQSEIDRLVAEADHLMTLFSFDHLPPHLRQPSQLCYELAFHLRWHTEIGYELVEGLRKLLEAKDCFVRAGLSPV